MASWRRDLQELESYVKNNPQIRISPNAVTIRSEHRPAFYELFDRTRANFIKEHLHTELEKSNELSLGWKSVCNSVKNKMDLEAITVQSPVRDLLSDPLTYFTKLLFQPLFDLLKSNIDADEFEDKSKQIVIKNYNNDFGVGYQYWAVLALIQQLQADAVYTVVAIDDQIDTAMAEMGPGVPPKQDTVPEAEATKTLLFENVHYCSFLTPRIIIRSKLLKRFVAFRPGFYRVLWQSQKLSENQEWLNIKNLKDTALVDLWADLALYVSDNLEDLALIADVYNIARPHIIVDFEEKDGWFESDGIMSILGHHEKLKPKLGSFLISRVPVPESARLNIEKQIVQDSGADESSPQYENLEQIDAKVIEESQTSNQNPEITIKPAIELICAGYDSSSMQSIVKRMLPEPSAVKDITASPDCCK